MIGDGAHVTRGDDGGVKWKLRAAHDPAPRSDVTATLACDGFRDAARTAKGS